MIRYDIDRVKEIVDGMLAAQGLNPRTAAEATLRYWAERGSTGVHYVKFYDIRRGVRLSRENLRKIAEALGYDPEPLLVAAGYERPSDPIDAVISVLREIRPETREDTFDKVREVMKAVLSGD